MSVKSSLFRDRENSLLNKPVFRVTVILIFLACLAVMRGIEPEFKALSGGEGMPDMRFGYDATSVYGLFAKLGAGGRSLYIENLFVDFLFLASFPFIQNFLLGWVMGRRLRNSGWRYLLLIADLRSLFDFLENLALLFLLIRFPMEYAGLAALAGLFTMTKFVMLGIWVAAVPFSFVLRVVTDRRVRIARED